jgi:DNA-binding NtrC family response regulator
MASSPAEAIDNAHAHAAGLDLLLTDLVMPDMTGRDLAELLLLSYPHLKCLYMSGYAENIIASHGILEEQYHFIQKPFSVRELSIRVQASLSS